MTGRRLRFSNKPRDADTNASQKIDTTEIPISGRRDSPVHTPADPLT